MDQTYHDHPDAGSLLGNEYIPIWQGGARRLPIGNLLNVPQIIFCCDSDLQIGDQLGIHKPTLTTQIARVEVFARQVPVGSAATFDLTDNGGTPLGLVISLNDGAQYQETIIGVPVAVPAGNKIGVVVTGVGSATPGSGVTLRLICV